MRLFCQNKIVAKSRFWYFLSKLQKAKRAYGEIVSVSLVCLEFVSELLCKGLILVQIREKQAKNVKTFGVWLRYDSRTGTHNMYKEYRELSRADAVSACYAEMASRHKARFYNVQIIRVVVLDDEKVRRPQVRQFLNKKLRFPLPHRVPRFSTMSSLYCCRRPSTFDQA